MPLLAKPRQPAALARARQALIDQRAEQAVRLLRALPAAAYKGPIEKLAKRVGVSPDTFRYSPNLAAARAEWERRTGRRFPDRMTRWDAFEASVAAKVAKAAETLRARPHLCTRPVKSLARALGTGEKSLRWSPAWKPVRTEWEKLTGRVFPGIAATAQGRVAAAAARFAANVADWCTLPRGRLAKLLGVHERTMCKSPLWRPVRELWEGETGLPFSDLSNSRRRMTELKVGQAVHTLAAHPEWCALPVVQLAKNLRVAPRTLWYSPIWKRVRTEWEKITGRPFAKPAQHWRRRLAAGAAGGTPNGHATAAGTRKRGPGRPKGARTKKYTKAQKKHDLWLRIKESDPPRYRSDAEAARALGIRRTTYIEGCKEARARRERQN